MEMIASPRQVHTNNGITLINASLLPIGLVGRPMESVMGVSARFERSISG